MIEYVCARCHTAVIVAPELEWEEGDICWACKSELIEEIWRGKPIGDGIGLENR